MPVLPDLPAAQPPPPLSVVVADDNLVVRAGLTALLSGREDITVAAEAADGREAYEAARRHRPDVVLLDVRMPGMDGLSVLPYLVPIAPVLMLTYSSESEIVQEALRRGAAGYLVHGEFTADRLVAAIRDVREGRAHFTATAADVLRSAIAHSPSPSTVKSPLVSSQSLSQVQPDVGQSESRSRLSTREAEIMDLIASGMNNQQIAATCFISEKTVKNHINRIFAKLHSTNRSEATATWLGTRGTG